MSSMQIQWPITCDRLLKTKTATLVKHYFELINHQPGLLPGIRATGDWKIMTLLLVHQLQGELVPKYRRGRSSNVWRSIGPQCQSTGSPPWSTVIPSLVPQPTGKLADGLVRVSASCTSSRPYKETLRRAPAALWWPCAILASSEAPICRAQLTLGEWAPMLTSDVSGEAVLSSLRKIKIPWDLGIGVFFFRPTPSWLSPGRSTCSIACRKTRLID